MKRIDQLLAVRNTANFASCRCIFCTYGVYLVEMKHLLPLIYIDAVAKSGSIRKAAESLAITSTALNRRILAMEEELGEHIFERMPRGVRLSAAGEIFIHHIRTQLTDMDRVQSQIADLSGVRRGHISIACSQALLPYFLPEQIAIYRKAHPAVTYSVLLRDRALAEQSIVDLSADLALVFEPIRLVDFENLLTVPQPIHAVMKRDHPLAKKEVLRLRDCLNYPIALPTSQIGVRHLLEVAARQTSLKLDPAIESDSFDFLTNYAREENIITFQIPIGLPKNDLLSSMISRPINTRDVPPGVLYFGQLRGRTLPVAAARFANQLVEAFAARFECD